MDDWSMHSQMRRSSGFEKGLAALVAPVISVCAVLVLLRYMQVLLVLLSLVPLSLLTAWVARCKITSNGEWWN